MIKGVAVKRADFLNLELGQTIAAVIAAKTGRRVSAAEIVGFTDLLTVTVSFEEDGTVSVDFEDPWPAAVSGFAGQGG